MYRVRSLPLGRIGCQEWRLTGAKQAAPLVISVSSFVLARQNSDVVVRKSSPQLHPHYIQPKQTLSHPVDAAQQIYSQKTFSAKEIDAKVIIQALTNYLKTCEANQLNKSKVILALQKLSETEETYKNAAVLSSLLHQLHQRMPLLAENYHLSSLQISSTNEMDDLYQKVMNQLLGRMILFLEQNPQLERQTVELLQQSTHFNYNYHTILPNQRKYLMNILLRIHQGILRGDFALYCNYFQMIGSMKIPDQDLPISRMELFLDLPFFKVAFSQGDIIKIISGVTSQDLSNKKIDETTKTEYLRWLSRLLSILFPTSNAKSFHVISKSAHEVKGDARLQVI